MVNGRNAWGTDVYTDDSSICRAAIHVGILDNNVGLVTVEKKPGLSSYTGSTRNGVTTTSYGSWSGSFVLHGSSEVPTQKPPESNVHRIAWLMEEMPGELMSILMIPPFAKQLSMLGILDNNVGLVTVEKKPGLSSYTGSTRNGVTTTSYGSWSGSFVLHGSSEPPIPKPTESNVHRIAW
ncbi:unnamed protein product, partial [Staurois parvus]